MQKRAMIVVFVGVFLLGSSVVSVHPQSPSSQFPDWSYNMRLWAFDILYPDTTSDEIDERLDTAVEANANAVIVYIEEEHMYGTFVDDAGFANILDQLTELVQHAHDRDLHIIVYVNGLEVMTHDAVDAETCEALPGDTLARTHPDWLQYDLDGNPIVFTCVDADWVTPDMEDAWLSPASSYLDLFKARLLAFGEIGVDGVYIDATFMPGLQLDDENLIWGSTDARLSTQFETETGYTIPDEPDWSDPAWRTWLMWRHTIIYRYLDTLAQTAWQANMVPFWESSTNDTPDATLLGNETAITAHAPLGFSPEIEPEGDWLAAFRMMHTARDFASDHPLIYLRWSETEEDALHDFANALSFSNTVYITADAPYPLNTFEFMETIQTDILMRRQIYQGNIALIYSVRNKDWDYEEGEYFDTFDEAYRDLTMAHLPFTVLVLEDLKAEKLAPFDTVVLPNIISISSAEYDWLNTQQIVLLGDDNGSRDEHWQARAEPLVWTNEWDRDLDELSSSLPFEIDAPETTYIAFYQDDADGFFLFASNEEPDDTLTISAPDELTITVYQLNHEPDELSGDELAVNLESELTILHIQP